MPNWLDKKAVVLPRYFPIRMVDSAEAPTSKTESESFEVGVVRQNTFKMEVNVSKTRLFIGGDETDVVIKIDNGAGSKFDVSAELKLKASYQAKGHKDKKSFVLYN